MTRQLLAALLALCVAAGGQPQSSLPFEVEAVAQFDEPWATAFLPDGRLVVTEKKGNLFFVTQQGEKPSRLAATAHSGCWRTSASTAAGACSG